MKIVIDTRQCPCRTLNDECDINGHECYEDDICSSCPLIRNGGVILPEGHSRLIDANSLIKAIEEKAKRLSNTDTINGLCGAVALIFDAPTIIAEADEESEK